MDGEFPMKYEYGKYFLLREKYLTPHTHTIYTNTTIWHEFYLKGPVTSSTFFQVLYIHVQSVSKDERLQHPAKDVISAFNEYTTNTLEAFYVMKKVRDAYYLP